MEKNSRVEVLSFEEFEKLEEKLPYKKNLHASMTPVQYCKIEIFSECIQGTMRVPKGKGDTIIVHKFGFYLWENRLYLIGSSELLKETLKKMQVNIYQDFSAKQILLHLMEELLKNDVLYLQEQEEALSKIEEALIREIPEHFYEIILCYRKRFNIYHAYYEQLMNIGDMMQTTQNYEMEKWEQGSWQLYTSRAERLHDHVEMLREYLVQIRELYQSLIDEEQSKVMSILTVVTTIFLPLSLIAGWYGMNFSNMPEFHWKYAYPVIIIISIITIIIEIIYFRKKKML